MHLKLRTRILLLVAGSTAGLAALVLMSLGWIMYGEIRQGVRADVRETGAILSRLIDEQQNSLLRESLLYARQPSINMLIKAPGVPGGDIQADPVTIVDSIREFLPGMAADVAVLTDGTGKVLGDTAASTPTRASDAVFAGIDPALRGESWSGIVLRAGEPFIAVSVPIKRGPEVAGTFSAFRRIDSKLASDLASAVGSDIAIVAGGAVIGASRAIDTKLPVRAVGATEISVAGTRYLSLYAPFPSSAADQQIGFVVLRPVATAMALFYTFRTALVIAVLCVLVLALVAGKSLARSITQPLDSVVAAAHAIREGTWPEPLAVRGHDEVALLQTVFNEMSRTLQANEERLLSLLDTDMLTELTNHRCFRERLEQEVARSHESGEKLALLLIDLDSFQEYNQRYGHAVGDLRLRGCADILRHELPDLAVAARYGGEKFAVMLPRHNADQAEQVAEKLRERLIYLHPSDEAPSTVSIGCAASGGRTQSGEELALAAELAVSQAKQLGRDRVCRFDSVVGDDTDADPCQLYRFLKDGSLATIQALAAAVDAKDPYTRGHSVRVAEMSSSLAKRIGLPAAEIELIHTTGTLHDVGKIGVPDAILKKPGRLDDDERTFMETHPVLGEVIVKKAPQLAATLPGVRHHHERWDGKGYPDGLAQENIPFMARILALADTFDAMTSDRPYRKGLDWEIALEEIERGSGSQFDPDLAAPFVSMMRERLRRRQIERHALPKAA